MLFEFRTRLKLTWNIAIFKKFFVSHSFCKFYFNVFYYYYFFIFIWHYDFYIFYYVVFVYIGIQLDFLQETFHAEIPFGLDVNQCIQKQTIYPILISLTLNFLLFNSYPYIIQWNWSSIVKLPQTGFSLAIIQTSDHFICHFTSNQSYIYEWRWSIRERERENAKSISNTF